MTEFNDQDLRVALNRAFRIVGIGTLVGTPIFWLAWGWPSAVFFLVGSGIAATGILEWRLLVSAIMARLDAGGKPKPMGRVLFWFFVRLAGAGILLYISLKSLEGRVSALIAGLALAMLALLIEAIRLLRTWSL